MKKAHKHPNRSKTKTVVSKVHNYFFSENQEIFQKNTRFLAFYGSKKKFFDFLFLFCDWTSLTRKE